jgi:hypothetical protein
MSRQLNTLRENIARVRAMSDIIHAINLTPAIDITDIYRSQWVMAVAALDDFVRQLILEGIMENYDGKRISKKEFSMQVDASMCQQFSISTPGESRELFKRYAISRLEINSYNNADKIQKGMAFCGMQNIWDFIYPKNSAKTLDVISKRRNQITHQFDRIEDYGLQKISYADINDVTTFILNICEQIDRVFYSYSCCVPPTS